MSFGLFVHDFDVKGKLFDGDITVANNALASKQYVLDAVAAGGGDWLASVLSEVSTAPSVASDGQRYLVGSSPSGWASGNYSASVDSAGASATVAENDVVEYDSANTRWVVYSPSLGSHVFVEGGSTNAGNALIYTSSGWVVTANATGALVASNNLSDLPNAATARSNLGLGDLAVQDNVDLASDVTGQLPVANGGTGASSAADARSNLGLGSIATQAADSVAITGGSIAGITDLAVADGGTGASTAADARSNLGLVIGTDVQAQNQALADIAGISQADGQFLVSDGTNIVAESGATARTSLGLGSAAVVDTGSSEDNVVIAAEDLDTGAMLEFKSITSATIVFNQPGNNWQYLYTGGSWSGPNSSGGTILSLSGSGTDSDASMTVSFSTGSFSSLNTSGGDSITASGYSFTSASASQSTKTGLASVSNSELRTKVGNASTASSTSESGYNRGLALFNDEFFTVSSGFVSLNTGIDADDVVQLSSAVTAGHLIKAQSLSTITGTTNAATSQGSSTVTTATDVTGAVAGQSVSFNSGYVFTLASAPVVDPNDSSQYIMTMTSSSSLNYAAYSNVSFTILGGDGFVSAGAAGAAANLDVATGVGSTAQGKVLKVSGSASLSANSLLAINSSGEIIAGSAGEQGTVTSIDLEAQDGSTSSAITTSGSIGVVGTGAISTSINSSNELEIAVAAGSTSATGTVQLASSSNYSGGTYVPGLAISSGGDLGQDKFVTLNSSAQIEFFTPDHFDIDGPIVKSCSGVDSSITMPSTVGALEGAYVINNASASSDVSVSLPTSVSAADRGATVTFKVHDLNGNKLRISGGTVSGGARMLIDGANYVDLDQARQSVTLHLSGVLGSESQSVDALCWSII
jgi:hypothetical protein